MTELDVTGLVDFVEIGRGGFSTVYRAHQPTFARTVALKVLAAPLDDTTRPRFERECQALGRLSSHPGIVTVYSSGETPSGLGYLVLEYCGGGSLAAHLAEHGPLPWPRAVDLIMQTASALAFAHDNGVLHRDIKPQNILLRDDGSPVLADFGIARLADGWHTTTRSRGSKSRPRRTRGTRRRDADRRIRHLVVGLNRLPPAHGITAISRSDR